MKKYKISKDHVDEYFQKQITKILKSKRMELGKSLEEVSQGICCTSYLSRIENNQVKLQEMYLKPLFEKLDIDYDALKEERKNNQFVELMKKVLLEQLDAYQQEVEAIMNSNHYLITERELILFYDNMIHENYEEIMLIMDRLETVVDHLGNQELIFYMYLVALYYRKTNQLNKAYRQINILRKMQVEDKILSWVIYELAMDIYFVIGKETLYVRMCLHFLKDAPSIYFSKDIFKHKLKMAVIEAKDSVEQALNKMNEYYLSVNDSDLKVSEMYRYHLGLIYLSQRRYQDMVSLLSQGVLSARIVKLLAVGIHHLESASEYLSIVKLINRYEFTKYDELMKNFCTYVTMKVENTTTQRLQGYLKTNVFQLLKYYFDSIVYENVIEEMFHLSVKSSKYKEACQLIMRIFAGLEQDILNR